MDELLSFCPRRQKLKTTLSVGETESVPLWLIRGASAGPTLAVTTGVHGCEFVGAKTIGPFFDDLDPAAQYGSLIVLPLVNPWGFYAGAKQVVPPDGKNLNREFPSSPDGTFTQRLAHTIEAQIYPDVDFLIDLHGGDINEDLTPLVFFPAAARLEVSARSREAACRLPVPYRVRSSTKNSLYGWAAQRGIPAILLELGALGRWTPELVQRCQKSPRNLTDFLGMTGRAVSANKTQRESLRAVYDESPADGFGVPTIPAGQTVAASTLLGMLSELNGRTIQEFRARFDATIMYYTTTLGVKRGDSLVAYAEFEENE
ncbi:MAG: M14 family metallopeptidase [Pyramidobacter sp.]|uniref:M14 family metallopeptidase n=1 Tax=Pyramidobacter sp. TaxID=1943581 RepID=UPI002A8255A9|nr:M14 family metallopeptidase [Pyramidobacter sp.]MDY4032670.1 M14 family metallopeptidase [Pyramidobacter sp.]